MYKTIDRIKTKIYSAEARKDKESIMADKDKKVEDKPKDVGEQVSGFFKGLVKGVLGALGADVENSDFFVHDVASADIKGAVVSIDAAVETTIVAKMGKKPPKEPDAPTAPAKAKGAKEAKKK